MSATLSSKEAAAKETITAKMSRWAAGLTYQQLSQEAVYQAKRFLLDSIGCALGGYQQHDVKIALELLDEIAGRGPATVIGTGKRIDAVSASLANALMIRCMDYNDIYWKQDPSHPSDIFPAALACCERAKSDGRELIVGLALGHEFEMRASFRHGDRRPQVQITCLADLLQRALMHDGDAVAQGSGLLLVVGHVKHGGA